MNGPTCTANCTEPSVGAVPSMFSSLITTILAAQCAIDPSEMWPEDYGQQATQQSSGIFDFVVVGSGAGGAVVAGRLSENEDFNVLLIEAGGNPPIESQLPPLYAVMANTPYDYNYTAYSDKACQGTNGVCRICRGKMLGGTTALNGLYYSRGNKGNYDEWESELGCDGWSYDDVLPYFLKSENNSYTPFLMGSEAKYHNDSGPLGVEFLMSIDENSQIFIDANAEKGVSQNYDPNGEIEFGIASLQFMARDGRRQSSVVSFINPVKDRPNLFVMKHSFATKVIIEDNVAKGVEINYNEGTMYTAYASKEVIVSAGVIGSPQLLMYSGVGPRESLEKNNIEVVADLPVGENLQDHVSTFLFYKLDNITDPKPTDAFDATYNLAIHNSGPNVETIAIASFLNTDTNQTIPNYEAIYFVLARGQGAIPGFATLLGLSLDILKPAIDYNENNDMLGIFFYLIQPESRGSMIINGSSPYQQPTIYPNYFDQEIDLENFAKAVDAQAKLTETQAFKNKSTEVFRIPLEDCDQYTYPSQDYWKCYIKVISAAGQHECCSVKMGSESDETTVVDTQCRVHGIPNLRVADASVFPKIISGHLTAPTMMVAERVADFIKATNGR